MATKQTTGKSSPKAASQSADSKEVSRERLSERIWKTIVAGNPDYVAVYDAQDRFLYLNHYAKGYSEEDTIGRSVYEFMPEDSQKRLEMAIDTAKKTGKPQFLQLISSGDEGKPRYFEDTVFPIKLDDGSKGVVVVAKDITERKVAEDTLRELYDRLNRFMSASTVMIYSCEAFGNFGATYISENVEKVLGYTPSEFLETDFWVNHIHPEDRDRVFAHLVKVFETGQHIHEYRFRRKDGDWRLMSDEVRLLLDEEGNPLELVGFWRDITQSRQTEARLREAQDGLISTLALTVETRDPYTGLHQKHVAKLATAIAEEMGLPEDNIKGLRIAALVHDIGKMYVPSETLCKPGPVSPTEVEMIKTHANAGYKIMKGITFDCPVAEIIHQHHERSNGLGYPRGLKRDEILVEARIMAVADVVAAMCSHRPYRPAYDIDTVLQEIETNKGKLYDLAVADACLTLFRKKSFKF